MKEVSFDFEGLSVYQKALDFIDEVYKQTESFPKKELYGLSSQFIRAACSISLNIAEGKGDSNAQFNRFLNIAKNSAKECVVCSTIAFRQGYIKKSKDLDNRQQLAELLKMIAGLQRFLKEG